MPPAQTHTLSHTFSRPYPHTHLHTHTHMRTHSSPATPFCWPPCTAPSAPLTLHPLPLPFPGTWHCCRLPRGVTEVVPAYTWLTRVNMPVAIWIGGSLSGLLDVLPARKTVVLRPTRTRSAGRQPAHPAGPQGPLAAGSRLGLGMAACRVGSWPCRSRKTS